MAHHHEKFLASSPSLNSTQVCYYMCSPKCSFVCFPPLPPLPFFFSPPPPPPPTLLEKQTKPHLSLLVIIIVAILASAFLLVSYYAIIVKYFSNRRTSSTFAAPPTNNNTHEDHDQTPNPMDLIWYVRTIGLEESVINSIAVCKYKRGEGLIEGTECSVCLNEFREDEDLRLLPKCSHAFHLPCIDTWLKSHVNCPLCRANVVSNPVSVPSTDPISISSDSVDETRVGNSQRHVELGSNRSNGVFPNQGSVDEDLSELGDLSSRVNCGFRAQSDLIDNHRSGDCRIEMIEDGIQPVRRSVSMDSSAAAMIVITLANLASIDSEGSSTASGANSIGSTKSNLGESSGLKRIVPKHGWNQSIFKTVGNCSKRVLLQKSPILMKRSFSGGGKFLLTRYGRSRNSVLPL